MRCSSLKTASRSLKCSFNNRYIYNGPENRGKTILSGIQPTGIPHLGNYLGALSHWVSLQDNASKEDRFLYTIVDLHALTTPRTSFSPQQKSDGSVSVEEGTLDMAASLLAVGIDPRKSAVFVQSHVPQHAEMMWFLSCITPLGKLNRMTTWKSKLAAARNANSEDEVDDSMLNVGLFTYPILQAADILLYRATDVPVGEDQKQHLELCRDIVELLNRRMQGVQPLASPEPLISKEKRILSLRDPSQKMSKSSPDSKSRIMLTDSYGTIRKKIAGAVTDSIREVYWNDERRGVCNLITILAGCSSSASTPTTASSPKEDVKRLAETIERCKGLDHARLKALVTEAVEEKLKGPRAEYVRIRADRGHLERVLKEGALTARKLAEETLTMVKRGLGLVL